MRINSAFRGWVKQAVFWSKCRPIRVAASFRDGTYFGEFFGRVCERTLAASFHWKYRRSYSQGFLNVHPLLSCLTWHSSSPNWNRLLFTSIRIPEAWLVCHPMKHWRSLQLWWWTYCYTSLQSCWQHGLQITHGPANSKHQLILKPVSGEGRVWFHDLMPWGSCLYLT